MSVRSTRDELLQRIAIDPNVCFGKPCIRGTRIWAALLLDLLAPRASAREVLEEYPQLTPEDLRAAIAYGSEMARERHVALPIANLPTFAHGISCATLLLWPGDQHHDPVSYTFPCRMVLQQDVIPLAMTIYPHARQFMSTLYYA